MKCVHFGNLLYFDCVNFSCGTNVVRKCIALTLITGSRGRTSFYYWFTHLLRQIPRSLFGYIGPLSSFFLIWRIGVYWMSRLYVFPVAILVRCSWLAKGVYKGGFLVSIFRLLLFLVCVLLSAFTFSLMPLCVSQHRGLCWF